MDISWDHKQVMVQYHLIISPNEIVKGVSSQNVANQGLNPY